MGLPDPAHEQQRIADAEALEAVVHRTGEIPWRLKRIRDWLAGPDAVELTTADVLALDEAIAHYKRIHATLERRRARDSG